MLRMVEPEYPRRAWVRDIDGWIDLEFTVTEIGQTRAIEVTGAKSRGWFDRAAIEAVEQWQFRPELKNGQPIEHRAKVRLQFTREE
ncbi:MAG: energy transducer TonB [Gammaproteobacteria bacterium]|nr:energy transducer TonB [Gammaproteobacteria bacterium]